MTGSVVPVHRSRRANVPIETHVAGAGGVPLAVRVHNPDGTKRPVLALHDLSANARIWDGVAGELAATGHPVAAVDQRGHGRSARPGRVESYDFAHLSDDLVAVLDTLGWTEPVSVAGHGWGGNVGLELAARHPERLAALALVEGGTIELSTRFADWPTCEVAMTPAALEGRSASSVERMLGLRHPDWPPVSRAAVMADVEILADGTVRPWLAPADYLAILGHLWEHHPSARYPDVSIPTLLVCAGDPDVHVARFETARREEIATAAKSLPIVVTRWIDGDYELHAQYPDLVASLLHSAADGSMFGD
jgi:pimeloyl-ACP methyl ester carboxylesterase